jgi:hypothetical protein
MTLAFNLLACAACYGKSDSPLALGLNWGIFSLLGVVIFVLGGFAGFFIYLVKRGSRNPVPLPTELSQGISPDSVAAHS